jgi:diadenylate cyclase
MEYLANLGIDINKLLELVSELGWANLARLLAQTVIIVYGLLWLKARIAGTQAERLLKGILVLVGICLVSWWAGFTIIMFILQQLIPVAVLALLIIFQPEIRRGLGYLGRGKGLRLDLSLSDSQRDIRQAVVQQIISAVRELARNRIGALIVVEPLDGERDYLSPGTSINADVSSHLLLSIFYPNSPLHDGALVIRRDKIVAAGVILPMTDNTKLSYRYGTRHRAALGLSEVYDALCIVVSEETGYISAASHGMLVRYNTAEELSEPLGYIYNEPLQSKAQSPLQAFLTLFSRGKKAAVASEPETTNPPELPTNNTGRLPAALELEKESQNS